MGQKLIRVLVVEDSLSMCKVFENILNYDPQIFVAGIAHNGKEAVELVPRLKPDIITMDIHMPEMDGLEATKQIMAYNPTPILIVSTSVFEVEMDSVFKAISYGALDVFEKREIELTGSEKSVERFIEKIKFLSNIKVLHHPLAKLERKRRSIRVLEVPKEKALDRIVVIVASTGGPQALLDLLKDFPHNFPCGIVIVQHIANGFAEGLADWLNSTCQIKVKIAEDSEEIQHGVAYVAPSGFQTGVGEDGRLHLYNEAVHSRHMPSGDVLLESAASVYKEGAVAVILTGIGSDGALGIKAIKQMHGRTIAQDEKSCIIFGMPKAAIEMDVIDKVLPLERIAEEIIGMLK